jgi:hypothetical protein
MIAAVDQNLFSSWCQNELVATAILGVGVSPDDPGPFQSVHQADRSPAGQTQSVT